jgi:formylglycine-generating enzyme
MRLLWHICLDFRQFVEATGFVTESERFGWSFVFDKAVPANIRNKIDQAVLGAEWWLPVNGSYWKEPEGPGTDVFLTNRSDYAVVQVSWHDAKAFCHWRGGRLPTEAEWEFAAKGPVVDRSSRKRLHLQDPPLFPWGNKLMPQEGEHRLNIFHGTFPTENTADDGYHYISPVDAFGPQNKYGFHNLLGNVWEWVEDYFTKEFDTSNLIVENPRGPESGRDKVKKGGSFLCHRSFCYRYRTIARFPSTPDSATYNVGFRCALDGERIVEGVEREINYQEEYVEEEEEL